MGGRITCAKYVILPPLIQTSKLAEWWLRPSLPAVMEPTAWQPTTISSLSQLLPKQQMILQSVPEEPHFLFDSSPMGLNLRMREKLVSLQWTITKAFQLTTNLTVARRNPRALHYSFTKY